MKTQTKIKIVSIALIMLAFSFTMSQEIDSAHKEPLKKSAKIMWRHNLEAARMNPPRP